MRKKAQREVLWLSLLRLALNRAAEAFIVVAWMDPLMGGRAAHSDFYQSTDDRADSLRRHAVKEPFVVAGSATRGRGDASEKRWPAAKADGTDER